MLVSPMRAIRSWGYLKSTLYKICPYYFQYIFEGVNFLQSRSNPPQHPICTLYIPCTRLLGQQKHYSALKLPYLFQCNDTASKPFPALESHSLLLEMSRATCRTGVHAQRLCSSVAVYRPAGYFSFHGQLLSLTVVTRNRHPHLVCDHCQPFPGFISISI